MICTCQISQTYSPSGRIGDKTCDFTNSDHLGSSSWTTDANGHAIQHIVYLPFGEEFVNQRTTSYEDRYTFTGKELDAESNLYYYDARYNSSTYSQFNSPDPMSDKLPNFNPYLYCYGSPAIACVSNVVVGNLKLKYYSKKGIDGVCEVNNAIGIVMDGWRHYFEAFMETIERIIYGDELADKDRLYDMHHWNAETILKIKERGK